MLKTKYENAPRGLLELATEYARKLNLDPSNAKEMMGEEITAMLLDIVEGKYDYRVYEEREEYSGDKTYIIHAWSSDLGVDYLIIHADIWVLGWW